MVIKNYQLYLFSENWSPGISSSYFPPHKIHAYKWLNNLFSKSANFIFRHGILAPNRHAFPKFIPVEQMLLKINGSFNGNQIRSWTLLMSKELLEWKSTKMFTYNLGDFLNAMKFTQCYCTALGMFQLYWLVT